MRGRGGGGGGKKGKVSVNELEHHASAEKHLRQDRIKAGS